MLFRNEVKSLMENLGLNLNDGEGKLKTHTSLKTMLKMLKIN